MKFKLTDAHLHDLGFVELQSLEDLLALHKAKEHDLIVSQDSDDDLPEILIYDDYLE